MANKVRVLVVDDEISSLSKMYINLLLKNYEVEATQQAAEVLPRIQRFQPDVVIISHTMPDLDAHALCCAAKELNLSFIVVVNEHRDTLPKIGNCTATDTLMRPIDLRLMESKIGSALV
jgi:DNA-binding NtrC family response regulator